MEKNTLEQFENYLKIHYGTKNTRIAYLSQIKQVYRFCNGNIDQENIDNYLAYKSDSIQQGSKNILLCALRTYGKFSKISIELPKNKKPERKNKQYITYEKLKSDILKYITCICPIDYNEKGLLLETMFFIGCRPEELCNLKITDLIFEQDHIVIRNTKGKVDRIVPFLYKNLKERLKVHAQYRIDESLFDINYGKLKYLFKKLREQLDLGKNFSPKTMRISFAKYCLSKGVDCAYIQKLLGHKDIDTTLIYAEPDEIMVKDACEKIKI